MDNLRSQKLHIPNLWPAFEGWKRGVNSLYYPVRQDPETGKPFGDVDTIDGKSRLKRSIDLRLGELFRDDLVKLEKAKAVDIGLFASCLFPDSPYEILETAAFYCIWLFFWDDAIDSSDTGDNDIASTAEAGREYCRKSVSFIRCCLRLPEKDHPVRCPAPTKVCASFEDVADRVREAWERGRKNPVDRWEYGLESFQKSLEMYMNACVVEQAWRLSSLGFQVPPEKEFWGWRLGTSSVNAFLNLSVILKDVYLYRDQLEFTDQKLAFHVNKLVVCINELFSLKKELKDRTGHMNLILITMYGSRDLNNLDAAIQKIVNDIHSHAAIFNRLARTSQFRRSPSQEAREQFDKMVAAYQAVVDCRFAFLHRESEVWHIAKGPTASSGWWVFGHPVSSFVVAIGSHPWDKVRGKKRKCTLLMIHTKMLVFSFFFRVLGSSGVVMSAPVGGTSINGALRVVRPNQADEVLHIPTHPPP
ncbi:isoprenoid synthase domain-containing protein [Rhypophila decipiens]|uniref:Isoprenoid synthase domain-containing protein n=1 Tax=Rhypophila decipiens TaxID=261697 RepID=A0AAN7BDD6_9PEZI|nr:isoprenoid synthase domain-containing protein [Rhypophila decipiens]